MKHAVGSLAPTLQFAVEVGHGFEQRAEQLLQRARSSGQGSDGLNQHSVGMHARPEVPEEAVRATGPELPARREELDELLGVRPGRGGHCATAIPSCACIDMASM